MDLPMIFILILPSNTDIIVTMALMIHNIGRPLCDCDIHVVQTFELTFEFRTSLGTSLLLHGTGSPN